MLRKQAKEKADGKAKEMLESRTLNRSAVSAYTSKSAAPRSHHSNVSARSSRSANSALNGTAYGSKKSFNTTNFRSGSTKVSASGDNRFNKQRVQQLFMKGNKKEEPSVQSRMHEYQTGVLKAKHDKAVKTNHF